MLLPLLIVIAFSSLSSSQSASLSSLSPPIGTENLPVIENEDGGSTEKHSVIFYTGKPFMHVKCLTNIVNITEIEPIPHYKKLNLRYVCWTGARLLPNGSWLLTQRPLAISQTKAMAFKVDNKTDNVRLCTSTRFERVCVGEGCNVPLSLDDADFVECYSNITLRHNSSLPALSPAVLLSSPRSAPLATPRLLGSLDKLFFNADIDGPNLFLDCYGSSPADPLDDELYAGEEMRTRACLVSARLAETVNEQEEWIFEQKAATLTLTEIQDMGPASYDPTICNMTSWLRYCFKNMCNDEAFETNNFFVKCMKHRTNLAEGKVVGFALSGKSPKKDAETTSSAASGIASFFAFSATLLLSAALCDADFLGR